MIQKSIILIDEPLENDHRVLNILKTYNNYIIVDCTQFKYNIPHIGILFFMNTISLFKAIIYAPFFWIKFYKKYNFLPNGFITGLKKSLITQYIAYKIFKDVERKYNKYKITNIYANDLTCGIIGLHLSKKFNCDLIYDAHELEFHRNRKNSMLRVVYDLLLEKKVINSSKKVIVVNKPISTVYQNFFKKNINYIEIVNNNHFKPFYNLAFDSFKQNIKKFSILYIGAATQNRMLENLTQECQQENITIYGFFLKNHPKHIINENWIIGSKDYLPELLKLIIENRLIMWCCANNICLSYQLGLPNKFFQAIAVGIPIIAYKNTYLAEIVKKYDIGYVYDDYNFKEIINEIKNTNKYYSKLKSVAEFQKLLFLEKLIL